MFNFLDSSLKNLTQEENVVQKIHWFGAFLTFILGNIWMVFHSFISIFLSIRTKKGLWRRRTAFVRLVITILSIFMVVAGIASAVVAAMQQDEGKMVYYIHSFSLLEM